MGGGTQAWRQDSDQGPRHACTKVTRYTLTKFYPFLLSSSPKEGIESQVEMRKREQQCSRPNPHRTRDAKCDASNGTC